MRGLCFGEEMGVCKMYLFGWAMALTDRINGVEYTLECATGF